MRKEKWKQRVWKMDWITLTALPPAILRLFCRSSTTTVNNHLSISTTIAISFNSSSYWQTCHIYSTVNMPPKAAKGEYIETVRHLPNLLNRNIITKGIQLTKNRTPATKSPAAASSTELNTSSSAERPSSKPKPSFAATSSASNHHHHPPLLPAIHTAPMPRIQLRQRRRRIHPPLSQ